MALFIFPPLLPSRNEPHPLPAPGVDDHQNSAESIHSERDPPFFFKVDRKSTRLNSSHGYISYAVFCLKKKKKEEDRPPDEISPVRPGLEGLWSTRVWTAFT